MRVKQAKLKDYVPFKGSDGETSSDVEDGDGDAGGVQNSQADMDDDALLSQDEMADQFKQLGKKMRS